MENDQTVIYMAANVLQAQMLKNALAEQGIAAYVGNEALQIAGGELPIGGLASPRVVVARQDAERARRIALDFERSARRDRHDDDGDGSGPWLQYGLMALVYLVTCVGVYIAVARATLGTPMADAAQGLVICGSLLVGAYLVFYRLSASSGRSAETSRPDPPEAEDEPEADSEAIAWPRCPSCSRPRHTACPVCETAGSEFATAFMPGTDNDTSHDADRREQLSVICPSCDEVFAPVFPARCEWCGHQFADGREQPPPSPWTSPFDEMTPQAWTVLAALAIFFAGLVALAVVVSRNS